MAYDTITTTPLPGVVPTNKQINTSVFTPVNNTRAFAETVSTGLGQLINNDVTLQANKLDGYHGGTYSLKSDIRLVADGVSDSEFTTSLPISFVEDNNRTGFIKKTINQLTLALTTTPLGILNKSSDVYSINTTSFTAGATRDVKFYITDKNNIQGKDIRFLIKDPMLGVGIDAMYVELYIYKNITDYNSHSKTNCSKNRITFGNNSILSVTFCTEGYYDGIILYPSAVVGYPFPAANQDLFPVTYGTWS